MDFKCSDNTCSYSVSYSRVKLINVNGILVPNIDLTCPNCGKQVIKVELLNTCSVETTSVSQGRFSSMTEKEKKQALKKRAQVNYKKFHQQEATQKQRDTINQIKEQFTKNIKR